MSGRACGGDNGVGEADLREEDGSSNRRPTSTGPFWAKRWLLLRKGVCVVRRLCPATTASAMLGCFCRNASTALLAVDLVQQRPFGVNAAL